jgi:hypothetical protein
MSRKQLIAYAAGHVGVGLRHGIGGVHALQRLMVGCECVSRMAVSCWENVRRAVAIDEDWLSMASPNERWRALSSRRSGQQPSLITTPQHLIVRTVVNVGQRRVSRRPLKQETQRKTFSQCYAYM